MSRKSNLFSSEIQTQDGWIEAIYAFVLNCVMLMMQIDESKMSGKFQKFRQNFAQSNLEQNLIQHSFACFESLSVG